MLQKLTFHQKTAALYRKTPYICIVHTMKAVKRFVIVFLTIIGLTVNVFPQVAVDSLKTCIAAPLLIFVAGVLLLLCYRVKQRYSQMLKVKNEELSAKRLQIEKQKQKIASQYKKLGELDAAKNRFMANISHEFRTPLSFIQGHVDDVLNEAQNSNLSEASMRKLSMVHRNTRQMRELADQLLDLAKLKAGKQRLKTKKQDIVSYIKQVIIAFDSGIPPDKSINLNLQCDVQSVCLYFDREKLDQIINNLLSNAIKSIEKQGDILISIMVPDDVDPQGATKERFCKISIKNTGKGIAWGDLPRIFDRFFQPDHSGFQNNPGTGIGLELCRELVELHGGHIYAESELNNYSVFTFELPMGSEHLEHHEITHTSNEAEVVEVTSEITDNARQQFIASMKATIEQHIADPHFGIRQLSEKAFLGERQLRRKITEITGQPPLELIRQIRLLHAKRLIEQHTHHTIAEVSAAVGFNNPAYFSRLFKKRFGMSPHELFISQPG